MAILFKLKSQNHTNKTFLVPGLKILHKIFLNDIFKGAEFAWIYVKHYVSKYARALNMPGPA